MALAKYSVPYLDKAGNALANVVVSVRTKAGAAVPIFSDRFGASPIDGGAVTTGALGTATFYCEPDVYDLVVTTTAGVAVDEDVMIGGSPAVLNFFPLQVYDAGTVGQALYELFRPVIYINDPRFNAQSTFTAKLVAAIAFAQTRFAGGGSTLVVPPGNNTVLGGQAVISTPGVFVRGEDHNTRLVRGDDGGALIKWTGSAGASLAGGGIRNLFSYGPGTSTVAASPFDFVFDNVVGAKVVSLKTGSDNGTLGFFGVKDAYLADIDFAVLAGTATDRVIFYVGSSVVAPAEYSGDLRMSGYNIKAGTGLAATLNADYCIKIEACDGFDASNGHLVNSALFSVLLQRNGANPIYNVNFNGVLLDHCGGTAFAMGGTGFIGTVTVTGRASSIGVGGAVANGVTVACPCDDVHLNMGVEGFKGSGIAINHAQAKVEISPRKIRNNDTDQGGSVGYGIFAAIAAEVTVTGGRIGGDGTQDAGVRIGAACAKFTMSGVDATGNQGASVVVDAPSGSDTRVINIDDSNTVDAVTCAATSPNVSIAALIVPLTFQNGWSNFASWDALTVRRKGRTVDVQGMITGGTATAATVFSTLPIGFRPATNVMGTAWNSATPPAPVRIQVATTGDMSFHSAGDAGYTVVRFSFVAA